MKLLLFALALTVFASLGCSTAAPVAVQNNNAPSRDERAQNTIAHGPAERPPDASNSNSSGGKWTQAGDPIDTANYDKAIADAEKNQRAKPADVSVNQALAQAYFERGFALTEARQYASALGDYRRALKLDPSHSEAKKWMDQINSIYSMLKKEAPKEGEEPPPLPMQKPAR